jgi:hypothetical protein
MGLLYTLWWRLVLNRCPRLIGKRSMMLWTTLRWNWGNTLAIGAFCLLPLIGLAGDGANRPSHAAPVAALQRGNLELIAHYRSEAGGPRPLERGRA